MFSKTPRFTIFGMALFAFVLASCSMSESFLSQGKLDSLKEVKAENTASGNTAGTDERIIVEDTKLPPIVKNISLNTKFNTEIEFAIDSSVVSDPEDSYEKLVIDVPLNGRGGTFKPVFGTKNRFIYIPSDFRGTDSVYYTVINTAGRKSSGVISVRVDSVFYNIKPALAVRASGCIMCHARINSNVVTDFGYGNSYFFGDNVPSNSGISRFDRAVYGDHGGNGNPHGNWITSLIKGEVYVPFAPLTGLAGVSSLAAYLRNIATPNIVEKSKIYIGAPSAKTILDSIRALGDKKWQYAKQKEESPAIRGLIAGPGNSYLMNDPNEEFICDGDLVTDAVLFLNSLKLRTSDTGCRIYSTKSVFIQGAITYLGENTSSSNLQIVSSRAILLGLGKGIEYVNSGMQPTPEKPQNDKYFTTNTVKLRLRDFGTVPGYFTRETGATQDKLDTIIAESELIPNLKDASATNGEQGRVVGFDNLLLVAPNIQSRYTGHFKGVIIAEVAIASPSQFDYEFASVFKEAPILPLLKESDFLSVE